MITFEQAIEVTNNKAVTFGFDEVYFEEAPGRILAERLVSDTDMPPFDKSAMDGFACKRNELPGPLKVIEVIRAGIEPKLPVGEGTCSQIMTGAILPQGADVVVRIEDCTILETGSDGIKTIRMSSADSPPNICYQGEDIQSGYTALEPGTFLDTRHVPVLAAFGKVLVKTYRQPTIGVLSTGTELVEPGETPARSQIRNTNAYQIIAQLKNLGIDAEYYGIAPDDEEVSRKMVTEALDGCDILILSGGVSMGMYDLIPSILENLGMKLEFRQIAIQPGKPTVFCTGQGKFVFGLPGNPVSSYFLFELLIKPFIYKCMGHFWNPPVVPYKLATRISRKKSDRLAWIPVRADDQGMVHPVDYHGSAHILALRDATHILPVTIGVSEIQVGTVVNVRPI